MRKEVLMSTIPFEVRGASPLFRDTMRFTLLAVVLGALLGLSPLGFAEALGAPASHLRISPKSYGGTQLVEVGLNKSLIVDLPADVREVIVSQPGVAGAIMRSKRRAVIQGSSAGGTNIFFLDAAGEAIAVLDVSVGGGADALVSTLSRIIPGSSIQVEQFGEGLVLSGTVLSGADRETAVLIASRFAGDASRVADALTVTGSQQVMLKVVVAEVKRDTLKQLGINLSGSLSVGSVNLGFNSQQADPALTNGKSMGISGGNFSLDAAIRALNQRDAIRLLAEPTLTAMSGHPAELLVGGELPIETTDNSGRATTEWKPFGVELEFTPTLKANGLVGLNIDTAVSELRTDGALNKRSVGTNVEIGVGQTLAIGGIIQDSVRQRIAGLPGLGDIPILGALFRSREYQRSQTDLVVLVTPYLAHPGNAPVLPTDKFVVAGDAEAIFLGHMEAMYGVGSDGMRGGYDGSVGFVLD